MFKKMYIILCLLFIINSCSDNSTTPNENNGSWIVNIYYMKYDNVNQKWDSSNKRLDGTRKYDGKTYFPEGDYQTMYGKNYWNHDYAYKYKKNFGNLLEDFFKGPYGFNFTYKYHYDEKGYLSKAILYNPENESIDTTVYINENGKLIEKRRLKSNYYSKYEYGSNNYIYKIIMYDSNNKLSKYDEFKYDDNGYRIETLGEHKDPYGILRKFNSKYLYNNSGFLIECIIDFIDSNKYTYKYNNNNLLIEEYVNNRKITSYKYDHNNYLIEIIYYDSDDKLDCKHIFDNQYIIE